MNLINVYTIYDSKSEAYLQPFFAPTHAVAFRIVEKSVKNPQSGFADFPADYTLFCIAQFDAMTGTMTGHKVHDNLGNLLQFYTPEPKPVPVSVASDNVAA